MHQKYNLHVKFFVILFFFVLIGCKPAIKESPLVELSASELQDYQTLKEIYAPLLLKVEQYEIEKKRISEIQHSYISDYIQLVDFTIKKTDQFDDGLYRACYSGSVKNTGGEIVDSLELTLILRSVEDNQILTRWKSVLVLANDQIINNEKFDPEFKSAIFALSGGKSYPLKPNSEIKFSKNRNCMKDVFLDWSEDTISYELTEIKLRHKVEEIYLYDVLNSDFYKMKRLEVRGKHFGQLN